MRRSEKPTESMIFYVGSGDGCGEFLQKERKKGLRCHSQSLDTTGGGADETRTRDLRRDRPAF